MTEPRTAAGPADTGVVDHVRFELDGDVAHVTLARPEKRNAQTPAMWRRLAAIGDALPGTVRVVVVAGDGLSFSAGLDRSMFATLGGTLDAGESEALDTIASYQAGFTWLRRPELVSVAAVQGHAIGAGFQLALACDVRIATTDVSFSMAEPTLGLVPDLGGTQVLVETIGYSRALEMCVTGRRVGADEARETGLVNVVVEADALRETVQDFVAGVRASVHGAATMTKALLLHARERSYADQLLAERQAQLERIRALAEDSHGSGTHP